MSKKEINLPEGLDADTAFDVLREYGNTDEAQIISSERIDALEAEIKEAKEAFAAVLAEESPQSADTLAKQDMDALTEPYRDDEGSIDVDTLRQIPETGEVGGSDNPEDPSDGFDVDNLSHEEIDTLKTVELPKLESFRSRGMDHRVDALESEIAERVGADDFEEIESELEAL